MAKLSKVVKYYALFIILNSFYVIIDIMRVTMLGLCHVPTGFFSNCFSRPEIQENTKNIFDSSKLKIMIILLGQMKPKRQNRLVSLDLLWCRDWNLFVFYNN